MHTSTFHVSGCIPFAGFPKTKESHMVNRQGRGQTQGHGFREKPAIHWELSLSHLSLP